jgi:hypothetical protein
MGTTLAVLPYLQRWNGSSVDVRLLLLPGDPTVPLVATTPASPTFSTASFTFDVHVVSGLGTLPNVASSTVAATQNLPVVSTAGPIFDDIVASLGKIGKGIDPSPPKAQRTPPADGSVFRVRKHLPNSYQQASGFSPGPDDTFVIDHTYSCQLKMKPMPPGPYVPLPPANPLIAWGRLIAALLRYPRLAEAAGLVRQINGIAVDSSLIKDGAYIYFNLSSTSDAVGLLPNGFTSYATRLPALSSPRDLFTPVLFPAVVPPVVTVPGSTPPPPGSLDYSQVFADVEDYDDGWAKTVHCAQPQRNDPLNDGEDDGTRPAKEIGIQIGWDDERVTNWMIRQLSTDLAIVGLNSPLGVHGYRIDVQNVTDPTHWTCLAAAKGDCVVNGNFYASYDGSEELSVEVHPSRDLITNSTDFWLPMYFASWTGPSLVGLDLDRVKYMGAPNTLTSQLFGVVPDGILMYGNDYRFRVRFMDHTGGGPSITSLPINSGLSPVSFQQFRRWIRPLAPVILTAIDAVPKPANPPLQLEIARPLIQYPAVFCTGKYSKSDLPIPVPGVKAPEPGLADPDVESVQITVLVGTLQQDPLATDGSFRQLYQTTRLFPTSFSDSIDLAITWKDVSDVDSVQNPDFNVVTLGLATSGPIGLPTARDIRLRICAVCREDPGLNYFGANDVRTGPTTMLFLRANAIAETALFGSETISTPINAYFLQPDLPVNPDAQQAAGKAGQLPPDVPSRLASALQLLNTDMTLRPAPGDRVAFGCSSSIRHITGPDLASIAISSKSDVSLIWVIVLQLRLNRDWTWDGLDYNGLRVLRDGVQVVRMSLTRNVNHDALTFPGPHRSFTDITIFDAIDPKPAAGAFPQVLQPVYTISYACNGITTTLPPLTIMLPVAVAPAQNPKIVSAGIAMSDYIAAPDYSSTSARQKSLWIEMDQPILDPNDKYFARVLRNAPDPLLVPIDTPTIEIVPEPELALDPEPIRHIVPQQSEDKSGLLAMMPLIQSTSSPVHFFLPLPLGLTPSSAELFGFFTYELRVGHSIPWSTAQGRFSPPLRISGVQHPAPQLLCTATFLTNGDLNDRFAGSITVSAPYALPVLNGVSLRPASSIRPPTTSLWAFLYAQATQIDADTPPPATRTKPYRRNVLILPPTLLQVPDKQPQAGYGVGGWGLREIDDGLQFTGFNTTPAKASLSVLVVEMLPLTLPRGVDFDPETPPTVNAALQDPLGAGLGSQRILRTSLLTKVSGPC